MRSARGMRIAARALAVAALVGSTAVSQAADHGDGPFASVKRSCDLGDIYFFLDPNDNTQAAIIVTTQGFIVPGEAVNFSVFDPDVIFRIDVDNDGDAAAERAFEISFGPKTAPTAPQTATIRLSSGQSFTAPTTTSNLSASSPEPVVTTDPSSGVAFFAGEADDPFFFDIPAFGRFIASVTNGNPDPSQFNRGRDTFAGYNTLAIALRVPVSLLQGGAGNRTTLGTSASCSTRTATRVVRPGRIPFLPRRPTGSVRSLTSSNPGQIDREGNPAVNVALVPFPQKDAYNRASPTDDANLVFANGIIGTLQTLGTSPANIDALATIAVLNGDYLRLSTTVANTGPGGGTNAPAGFPNGRRLGDDVIDTLLNIISNGGITAGDNVDANDVPARDEFPFVGATQQPFATGTTDDRTRN